MAENKDGSPEARQEVQNNLMPEPTSQQEAGEEAASKASPDFPSEPEETSGE